MLSPGKKIAGYSILSEIGAGGMAVIYKAMQPSLERLVAIKELRPEFARDLSIATRFEREAKGVAALAHQNIVHIYDFVNRGETMFIAMELVEGIDLGELIAKTERIPPEIAALIALQAARALEYAHYLGVVHRDFKPSNVMITKQGEVKLMDFGIARHEAYDDLTKPGIALGTPAYMSPEQILGQKVDFRSDIFSFGVVLYQMLTGQKPFADDDNTKSVLNRILSESYKRPRKLCPQIPRELQSIIKRCLKKPAEKRYQKTEELSRDLEKYTARTVTTNYNGRLVVFLHHRQIISASEAKTFVPKEELESQVASQTDSGQISRRKLFVKPLLAFSGLLLLAGYWILPKFFATSSASGFVRVNATPWAEVWVDGTYYDTTPFAKPISLKPGRHQFDFKNSHLGTRHRLIEIRAGTTQKIQVEFDKP